MTSGVRTLALIGIILITRSACDLPPTQPQTRIPPVIITSVEQLIQPLVTGTGVFRPQERFSINNTPEQAFGFFMTLAADNIDRLRLRIVDTSADLHRSCARIDPPSDGDNLIAAAAAQPYSDTSTALLDNGECVFWIDQTGTSQNTTTAENPLIHHIGIMSPERLLSGRSRVEVYTEVSESGTVLGADSIQLSPDFFYIAVVGDSVAWGNGLNEGDKASTRVAKRIEQAIGKRVIMQVRAHSAANILPLEFGEGVCDGVCSGEVPLIHTAILNQVGLIEAPEELDLVLIVGCINDIGLTTILNPFVSTQEIAQLTEQFCNQEMVGLLNRVRQTAPQAKIVVASYYQFVGEESDPAGLLAWALTQGIQLDELNAVVERTTENSIAFDQVSRAGLAAAVAEINQAAGDTIAAFAPVDFTQENVVFGPDPWVWGLDAEAALEDIFDFGVGLIPQDPLRVQRAEACPSGLEFPSLLFCVYASVGHPNRLGARSYERAILHALEELGILPILPMMSPTG